MGSFALSGPTTLEHSLSTRMLFPLLLTCPWSGCTRGWEIAGSYRVLVLAQEELLGKVTGPFGHLSRSPEGKYIRLPSHPRRGWVKSSVPSGHHQSPGGPDQCALLQYDWYTKVTSVVVDVVPRQLGGKGCVSGRVQWGLQFCFPAVC